MRVLVQRVAEASVTIAGQVHGKINSGLLVFVGIENEDTEEDVNWISQKILQLRIFNDENDKMNLSVLDIKAELLVISQFTLHASVKKGNRPSFIKAAKPETAIPLYESFIKELEQCKLKINTGIFGAEMQVHLINEGPVTIWVDSKERD